MDEVREKMRKLGKLGGKAGRRKRLHKKEEKYGRTAEVIREELKAGLRKENEILEQIKLYKETHGSEYFKPWEHQQRVLDLINIGKKKTVVLLGGNQIGKTALLACIADSWASGVQAWDKKLSVLGPGPKKIRIMCSDWEHHAGEVVVPALKQWIPTGSYETNKNHVGIEAFWSFKNGSTFELLTHLQETKVQEGWVGDGVLADENLPRDKYTANKRGLVFREGVFLITLTEVEEGWILDDLILSNDPSVGFVTDIPMRANPLLTEEAIANFMKSCTPEELEARVYGKSIRLAGRICKEFYKDKHVIEPFPVLHDWPVVAMIDIHPSKPQAIGFYAADPRDTHYVVDEIWEHLSPEEIADRIIKKRDKNQWNLRAAYIDPLSKGDGNYMRTSGGERTDSFSLIETKLGRERIALYTASKDKDSGIRNIKTGLLGPNKMPSLFFFNTVERHIWEIQRWKWDSEEKASKVSDDMMENLYRYTLVGNKYIQARRQSSYKTIEVV